jgi:hypothetical protein
MSIYRKRIYDKEGKSIVIDVYDVLLAYDVNNHALAHLIKKALVPGGRGHKSLETDLQDIVDSALRAQQQLTRPIVDYDKDMAAKLVKDNA